jgi:hypothetical protein
MTYSSSSYFRKFSPGLTASALFILLLLLVAPVNLQAEPSQAAVAAYNAYAHTVESRLAQQHRAQSGFLVPLSAGQQGEMRLRKGELIVEKLTPSAGGDLPGALLHHWRGTAFVPGVKAVDLERLMRDCNRYPQIYSPQVLQAKVLTENGDQMQTTMRVRQQHVLTVVLDMAYDVTFGRLDAQHGSSNSISTRIAEIDHAGARDERTLSTNEEHGYLWRQNTYWSYEERDGGLYLQVESVSLTRSIPTGLGWAIRPFVESVPRESLEFTLRSTCNALHK